MTDEADEPSEAGPTEQGDGQDTVGRERIVDEITDAMMQLHDGDAATESDEESTTDE